ncbi:MAG: response regulator [Candidatus Omnitrophica bacterium]|nr:response regulator [Candidatus Omnitrophota bacterium]
MRRKILIIDDEVDFANMVKLNLSENGFDVRTESDGRSVLNFIKEFSPELILLDVVMPKIDGFNVLKILKNNPQTMSIPVIMLTAIGTNDAKIKAAGMYCEEYVLKPIDTEALVSKINEVLERR